MMATTLIVPLVPDILDDFDVDRSQAGVLITASTIPAIVAAPVMGMLADRFGRRPVLLPCLAGVAVLGLASAAAPTYGVLLVLRILQGIAAAGLVNLAIVLIADQWEGHDRTRILGRNAAVLTASIAVLPPVSGAVAGIWSWRSSFGLYVAAFAAFGLARRSASALKPASPPSTVADILRGSGAVLRIRELRRTLVLGGVTLALVFGWTVTLTPLHIDQVLGRGPGARGALVGLSAGAATIAALNSRRLVTSPRPHLVTSTGLACFTLGYATVGLRPGSIVALAAGMLAAGAGQGMLVPALQSRMAAAAPAERRGVAMSLWGSVVRTGQTVGPLLIGGFLYVGTTPLFIVGAALAALAAVAVALTGWIGRTS